MYSTCLFCQQSLGKNDVVERFPIGRRLAYDASRGRLWVVCRSCERWNLTPLEARWEAIEDCERLFRGTRLRTSTDQIGLARLKEGLELVRIGEPLRPEMAAWRYGDQFGRRFRRHVVGSAVGVAVIAGAVTVGPVMGLASIGGLLPAVNAINLMISARRKHSVVAAIAMEGYPQPLVIRASHLTELRLTGNRRGGFELHAAGVRRVPGNGWSDTFERPEVHRFTGDEAIRVAARILPRLNRKGARRRAVTDAVGLLELSATPSEMFARIAETERRRQELVAWRTSDIGDMSTMPMAARLALEMASHEDAERRALEGELAELECAWRDAEEIAAIADELALPSRVHSAFDRLKSRGISG